MALMRYFLIVIPHGPLNDVLLPELVTDGVLVLVLYSSNHASPRGDPFASSIPLASNENRGEKSPSTVGQLVSNGTVSVWSTSSAGIDTVLATTLGTTVTPKTYSTGQLHQTGLSLQPNGNGNGHNGTAVHHHPNVGNGTGLNHAHLHLGSNGNSHSGSIGNNSTHSLTPHGGHGATSWNNRTSICSTHNKFDHLSPYKLLYSGCIPRFANVTSTNKPNFDSKRLMTCP
uniref:Uncharacterized protein n=1 Tax=Anopheles culicifacies TaxID=139723 RepID=A0A182MIM7_9DIPT